MKRFCIMTWKSNVFWLVHIRMKMDKHITHIGNVPNWDVFILIQIYDNTLTSEQRTANMTRSLIGSTVTEEKQLTTIFFTQYLSQIKCEWKSHPLLCKDYVQRKLFVMIHLCDIVNTVDLIYSVHIRNLLQLTSELANAWQSVLWWR